MVDCTEFLESYSDYRDGLLTAGRSGEFESHVRSCGSCARYDRVVGGGVQVFRSLPVVAPSADFQARLLHRLHVVDSAMSQHGSGASLAVTLMICLALGAGAWLPALRPQADEPVRLPAIVAHAPYHDLTPVLMRGRGVQVATPLLQAPPAYYGQGLLLERSPAFTTLAFRPASTYYTPR